MSTDRTEIAPRTWDDARDARFFAITARLFAPDVCLGATVLLASYDDEPGARPLAPAPVPATVLRVVDQRAAVRVPPAGDAA